MDSGAGAVRLPFSVGGWAAGAAGGCAAAGSGRTAAAAIVGPTTARARATVHVLHIRIPPLHEAYRPTSPVVYPLVSKDRPPGSNKGWRPIPLLQPTCLFRHDWQGNR